MDTSQKGSGKGGFADGQPKGFDKGGFTEGQPKGKGGFIGVQQKGFGKGGGSRPGFLRGSTLWLETFRISLRSAFGKRR